MVHKAWFNEHKHSAAEQLLVSAGKGKRKGKEKGKGKGRITVDGSTGWPCLNVIKGAANRTNLSSEAFSKGKIMKNILVLTLVHAVIMALPNVTPSSDLDPSQFNHTWDGSGPIFPSEL